MGFARIALSVAWGVFAAFGQVGVAAAADTAVSSPVPSGTLTIVHGYNDPMPGESCSIGRAPDHCGNQRYGLDLRPSNLSDRRIVAPLPGRVAWISGDCLGIRTEDDLNLNVCHFSSFSVSVGSPVYRSSTELGMRSTDWIHLSLDNRYRDSSKPPVAFNGAHAIMGASLDPNDGARNVHNGGVLGASSGTARSLGRPDLDRWCKTLGHRGVTTVRNDAYGLMCVTQSGSQEVMSVLAACQQQTGNSRAVDIMRNFNDPYDWECYDTGTLLGAPDLNAYCRSIGYERVTEVVRTAYGLRCERGNTRDHMSVLAACKWQFGRQDVIDSMRDFYNPQDWKCWSIN